MLNAHANARSIIRRPLLALALAALALLARPIAAQPVSPAELRREIESLKADNQRLATLVADLTTKLAEAEAARDAAAAQAAEHARRIVELEDQIRRGGANPGTTPGNQSPGGQTTAPQPAEAPIPDDPMASPASLLAELQRRYAADFPDAGDADAPPAFTTQVRKSLEAWCTEQARSLRGSIEWRVRFTDLRAYGRNEHAAMMSVIDTATGLQIGQTLEVAVPRAQVDRLARALGPTGGDDKAPLWTLTGRLTAAPSVSPDRPGPGVFNHPAFIGPYVEFGFDLDWESAAPIESEPAAQGT